ncbi:MAG: hypothetical protein ACE3L7_24520 [Candidatus Pristimantibacillus sp.]
MEKRLTRSAMLFSLGFIFMLVFAVSAFFYGVKIGSAKTEERFEQAQQSNSKDKTASPYQQQDLVSYYHTVFLPYREFQTEWFNSMNKLTQGQTTDARSTFKDLANLAKQKNKEASSFDMQKSPLLGEAQVNTIRSLELFEKVSNEAASSSKSLTASELQQSITKKDSYITAVNQSLIAQQAYYSAMLKWGSNVDPNIPGEYKLPSILEINQWKELPLTVKNKLMSDQLLSRKQLTSYYPQDITSRVDEFINSGQPAKMKVRSISAVVELLINTEAVRSGDFTNNKAKLYEKEILPLLPFFYPVNS